MGTCDSFCSVPAHSHQDRKSNHKSLQVNASSVNSNSPVGKMSADKYDLMIFRLDTCGFNLVNLCLCMRSDVFACTCGTRDGEKLCRGDLPGSKSRYITFHSDSFVHSFSVLRLLNEI